LETIVHFGAGNIGRGFMGQLYTEAGFEVVFVDVVPEVVAALSDRREYPLRLAGPDRFETLTIRNVRAVSGRDPEAVAAEIAGCNFVSTAVGVPALPHIIPALAAGIQARAEPLNVILCENQLHCSDLVRGLLAKHLSAEKLASVGLIESVVSRMVPVLTEEDRARDPLLAVAEDYASLPIDQSGLIRPLPPIAALRPVGDFGAYVERKLYMHNMGHAVSAYLGYRAGYRYVYEAMADTEIGESVEAAMRESAEALHRKNAMPRDELAAHAADLVRRFRNAALGDTVLRVARDPIRKLRPDDRLIGAALTCLDWDVEPTHIIRGIVAAFQYNAPGDPAAEQIQAVLREQGIGQALLRFTGHGPETQLGRLVLNCWPD
jgi:mannitol-1-phosphate 5-dehydrogenase